MTTAPAALLLGAALVGAVTLTTASFPDGHPSTSLPSGHVAVAAGDAVGAGQGASGRLTGSVARAAGSAVGVVARRPTEGSARYRWPLRPVPHVLRRFAMGPAPWSPGHRGVDLTGAPAAPVLAAGPGTITFAGRIAGVGAVAVTHDDGLRTTYQPVAPDVRVGDMVSAGQMLGRLDTWRGHCPGPCLHWGAIRGGAYVDPLALLGLVPPVLLPVP